ncbi:MAG: hypothetical protein U0U46_06155 [Saprospiraceae bacterium]
MSELLEQLEQFLLYENWQHHPQEIALLRVRLYRSRQLPREASFHLKEAGATLDAQPQRDAQYYLYAYRLQEELLLQAPTRGTALNMQEMSDELDAFFAAEMLRNACTALSHQAVYRADYRLPYLEAVLADCAAGRFDRAPVIRLYYLSYRCLTHPESEADFFDLKKLLPRAGHWLPQAELRNVLTFAINYCIRRLNTGGEHFFREVFDLYRMGLAQNAFLENGVFNRFTFKNIVAAALKLGEMDWTEDFIGRHASQLPAVHHEAYERFTRAKVAYQRGDYDRVRTLLADLDIDDVFLRLDARVMLLKVYFESGEWRLLRGFLVSFERFVSRKKMLPYQAPNYLNIIHLTQKILHFDAQASAEEYDQLQQQIRTAQPLTERGWLLARLEERLRTVLPGSSV